MILTDNDILKEMRAGRISITDFDESRLGSNSYDLTLGNELLVYPEAVLDCAKQPEIRRFKIPKEGCILKPGELYLGVTRERTNTPHHVPQLEGKSSIGRLGITAHVTAGFGDIGFEGYWTLEITVVKDIKIYAGMPIAQIFFFLPLGTCNRPYGRKKDAKYASQGPIPIPSQMYKNFIKLPAHETPVSNPPRNLRDQANPVK